MLVVKVSEAGWSYEEWKRALHDAGMVGDVGYLGPVPGELDVASEPGETVGGRLLDLRGGDNGLCDAEPNQVTLCQCGHELKEEQIHGHYRCMNCKCVTTGCCGDV